ncbi:MAG: non-ribosomal peptide synthetase, partial [Gemmatimonadales bacterium]
MSTASPSSLGVTVLTGAAGNVQVMPTSFAQERFFLLEQIEPDAAIYTIPVALQLRGPLNAAALEGALNAVVARHEALRTGFDVQGDDPVQVVFPALRVVLGRRDLSSLPPEAREEAVLAATTGEANRGFDLRTPPLVRAVLLRLAPEEHVLLLTAHHIVTDGWSFGVLYREVAHFYGTLTGRSNGDLPPLPIQYPDYAVWQRRAFQGATIRRQLAYWQTQLRGPLPVLELPLDRPRPALQSYRGARREIPLPKALVESVRALCRAEGATPFMGFLAGFHALLHRYSGQEDLTVGTLTSGRHRTEVEPLIGLFVNTLAVRVDLSGTPSFTTVLARVREAATAAYANQEVPFEQVVQAVEPERDRSRSPIFQAAFQLLETITAELELPGVTAVALRSDKATTKFDLTLMLSGAPGGALRAIVEYNTDLFDAATMDRLLAHYRALLEGAVRAPHLAVAALPLLTPAERKQVVEEWNATEADYPREATVHALVAAQAAETPNAVAVEFAGERLTYAELEQRAERLAAVLRARGVGRDTPVALCVERSPDMVIGMLGIWKAGGAYVPLDPAHPAERLAFVLEDVGAALVLAHHPTVQQLETPVERLLLLDAPLPEVEKTEPIEASPDDLAYVIYTSGSTGKPKGVEVSHRAVVNFLASMRREPGLTARDTLLAVTTLSFDIAGLEIWLPLTVGARVVIAPQDVVSDGPGLAELMASCGTTVMQATPATWQLLLESGWLGSPHLRVLCGGEAFPPRLAERLVASCASVWNMYGPTETTIWSAVRRIEPNTPVTIGGPIANTRFYVLDARGQPQPVGVAGELCIGGDG